MGIMALGQNSVEEMDRPAASLIAAALPMPVLLIGPQLEILFVNQAAEQFFDMGAGLLVRQRLPDITPFASPLIQIIAQARERGASISEHDVDLTTPRHGERLADVIVTPVREAGRRGAGDLAGARLRASPRPPAFASRRRALASRHGGRARP